MYNSDDGVIIAISAAKYEPRNFWTGSWRAVWRVSFAAGTNKGADIKVNGQLDLSVHFYEDGNVQLRAGNALEAKVKVMDCSACNRCEKKHNLTRFRLKGGRWSRSHCYRRIQGHWCGRGQVSAELGSCVRDDGYVYL